MLTAGSLFSGIGGIELGFERAGIKTMWQCENNSYARKVLARNFKGVKCYDDITRMDTKEVLRPDILCGGFPCQPHSLIGKREGSADERDLWPEFSRIIKGIQPRWVVAENVASILRTEDGRFFGRILRDLADLGFTTEWHVVSACSVGAPHMRDRLFIISHANSHEHQGYTPPLWRTSAATIYPGRTKKWAVEPAVHRVAYGVPRIMDRIRCLGNAVVPQVAEQIGRFIVAAHQAT